MKAKSENTLSLFKQPVEVEKNRERREELRRLDLEGDLRKKILSLCRLKYGQIWEDPIKGHRVGVLDATKKEDVGKIMGNEKAEMMVNDPPYNVIVGSNNTKNLFKKRLEQYLEFSKKWVENSISVSKKDAHLYIWLGADYKDNFQPLPDFILLLRDFRELSPKNFITMRNQRGYGTQKNWMWVRQELLYYVKGDPKFSVEAEYTEIPKILRGYYKEVSGRLTENMERSRSEFIRAGNVWVDIQQVFYRMRENVPGCYAQKPLKAIERILKSGSKENQLIVDFFSHSGATLIAGEKMDRKVFTFDIDPIFAEITIRRIENFRQTGEPGWQWRNPFPEIETKKSNKRWI
jgi:site-specific DNA-methyltransferase (adenine-specific)